MASDFSSGLAALAEQVRRQLPPGPNLRLRVGETSLHVGIEGEEPPVVVHPYDEEWTVYTPEGHGHFETTEEAAGVVASLLLANARFVTEYRGDRLASSWLETKVGEIFQPSNMAVFLCPFDPDEWVLWPGETWRTERVTRLLSLSPEGKLEVQEHRSARTEPESVSADQSMFGWLTKALGPADEGMRWTVGLHMSFVFQAPKGWRRKVQDKGDSFFMDFSRQDKVGLFRIQQFFRDEENPAPDASTGATRAQSIQEETEHPSAENGKWQTDRWKLLFSNGQQRMMAIVELILQPNDGDREPLKKAIGNTIARARYVPSGWNMAPEDPAP